MRTATNSSIAVRYVDGPWLWSGLSKANLCSANTQRNMQCIDNTVIMQMGGHGPFPVQNGPPRR
ncbi:hypothetical protein CEK26_005310 [Fusarium fujikuroi]|nr:hypothetical protein CEK27_005314 [Fusarium fujikuroi]QGI78524.1 hypothetical protein CEK25_005253 [Fusarium fujikuroi]QGI92241.1 hypothetical protein CEK26_005310 [Fusarium fujikuroi]